MQKLIPEVEQSMGAVPVTPWKEIETLLSLANE